MKNSGLNHRQSGGDDEEGCEHSDHSSGSNADSPDTDAGHGAEPSIE